MAAALGELVPNQGGQSSGAVRFRPRQARFRLSPKLGETFVPGIDTLLICHRHPTALHCTDPRIWEQPG